MLFHQSPHWKKINRAPTSATDVAILPICEHGAEHLHQPKEALMDPLIIATVILVGLVAIGRLFDPAREPPVVIVRETPQSTVRGSGCSSLLVAGFLALLLLMLLFGGH
jgi:hypothetical protein